MKTTEYLAKIEAGEDPRSDQAKHSVRAYRLEGTSTYRFQLHRGGFIRSGLTEADAREEIDRWPEAIGSSASQYQIAAAKNSAENIPSVEWIGKGYGQD